MLPPTDPPDELGDVLADAVRRRVTPAAVLEVGTLEGPVWRAAHGTLSYEPASAPATIATIFDLASLTKVIATTSLVMRQVEAGTLALEAPVSDWIPEWRSGDRGRATLASLLDHSSGLPAVYPFYESCRNRDEVWAAIREVPLAYAPGSRAVYSDVGFILLGFLVERVVGQRLDQQFEELVGMLGRERMEGMSAESMRLTYRPGVQWKASIAPTQVDAWRGRLLQGEVDDRNAAILGGVAGHSGLFGTVEATGTFARDVLGTLEGRGRLSRRDTLTRFVARSGVWGSSRALGWDTMLPTSSCGSRMSVTAFGHTGFTGTSLWLDPERKVYVVLLTNRVHPVAGPSEGITQVRRAVHDAVVSVWDRESRRN